MLKLIQAYQRGVGAFDCDWIDTCILVGSLANPISSAVYPRVWQTISILGRCLSVR